MIFKFRLEMMIFRGFLYLDPQQHAFGPFKMTHNLLSLILKFTILIIKKIKI